MGLFDFNIVCVTGEYDNALKYISWKFEDKELLNPENDFNRGYEPRGQCFFRRGYIPVVWLPKKPKTAREHATLAHECIHAVMHLFDWAALSMNIETEEVLTHSTAHLMTNILKSLR